MSFIDLLGSAEPAGSGPRYIWVEKLIRDAITSGQFAAGSALPSEREFCDALNLSRVTIRKAMESLVNEGLLMRRRGAGTFLSSQPVKDARRVEKSFSRLSSFTEDMLARGRRPSSRWIDRTEGAVTPVEALALGLSPGSRVYRLQRIRFADEQTMAIEHSTIPVWGVANLEAVEGSLYEALVEAGNQPVRALQRVRAVSFTTEQAILLDISEGDPGLLIERRAFTGDGRVIEVTDSYYRGDAYDLVAELHQSE